MRPSVLIFAVLVVGLGLSQVAPAEEKDSRTADSPQELHVTTGLDDLLKSVSKKSGKEFLVDRQVLAEVVTGTVELRDIDYEMLLSILRNNGLAAVPSEKFTKIIPVRSVRHSELPVIRASDASIPDDAWVTRIMTLEKANAPGLVPLLRPMIQQEGHLVAESGSNLLVIVAPYGVSERLAGIVAEIDRTQRTDDPTH